MLLNSLMGEGLAGMQHSQSKMHAAARDIARAGLPAGESGPQPMGTGPVPASAAGVAAPDLSPRQIVPAALKAQAGSERRSHGDVIDALVEQRRQLTLFNASAKIVTTANESLGRLIDDLS